MDTIKGVVQRIVYEAGSSDFKVFRLRRKDRSIISVTGDFPSLIQGAAIEVHGNFKTHPKYGVGFKADAHTHTHDGSARGMCLYLMSIAKFVGPDKSARLAEHFGEGLEKVIESEPDRLTEVEGIGPGVASSIVEAWAMNKTLKDVKIFLHGLGLTDRRIRRILTSYGPDSESILKEDPWSLTVHGFGFGTCDHIAQRLGKDRGDPLRWRGFTVHALAKCSGAGHLFLTRDNLIAAYNQYSTASQWPFMDGEILWGHIEPHIGSAVSLGMVVVDGPRLYGTPSFFHESESARLVHKMLSTDGKLDLGRVNPDKFIGKYEELEGITLSDAQRDAVRSFLTDKMLIITGGPGTGKTTIVRALVSILSMLNASFELLTPTGISAKKLGTTAGCPAYTIHRRLGYKGDRWDFNALVKYPTQAVIVDETSMVDQEVLYRLLSALLPSTKIVFVGDNDQLPSVGPGSVLRELIESGCVKTIFLDKIFRQERQSDIIKAAKRIRDGDPDLSLFKADKAADIWLVRGRDHSALERTVVSLATQIMAHNRASADKKHFQIITPRNSGPLSVDSLNEALQAALNPPSPDKKEFMVNRVPIRKGDRVIVKKNNYQLEVFNGDIGKVAFVTPDHVTVDIEDYNDATRRVDIPMREADEMLRMAYAITVHRAQGLEYPLVIMPFVQAHGRMLLQRNLLYTALTRAKRKVIVLGQASALEKAIANDRIQRRNTLLAERIRQWGRGEGRTLRSLFPNPEDYRAAETLKRLLSYEANS